MEYRQQLLKQLIAADKNIDEVISELKRLPWDATKELVLLTRHSVINILTRYSKGSLDAQTLEIWADAIEGRDDIGYEASHKAVIQEIIYQLANPVITLPLTPELTNKMLKALD